MSMKDTVRRQMKLLLIRCHRSCLQLHGILLSMSKRCIEAKEIVRKLLRVVAIWEPMPYDEMLFKSPTELAASPTCPKRCVIILFL